MSREEWIMAGVMAVFLAPIVGPAYMWLHYWLAKRRDYESIERRRARGALKTHRREHPYLK